MAGRIPQAFLDALLDRVDIVEVIDRRVKLKKTGKNYSARCPFHEEKTPSFSVNPDKQFYYCFGCGAGGNALGFLMDYENIEFPQAVDVLAGSAGMEVPREQTRSPQAKQREEGNKQLYTLMEKAADFYRQALRQHPQAKQAVDYLKGRGLSGEIARDFDLGYAPPGWDNLLKHLGTSEAQQELLLRSGMLVKNEAGRLYDRFRHRVMFPIRDQRGRIIAFGGRVLGDDKPKYLNSPETDIFHKGRELYGLYQARKRSRKLERLLVVEGYMDVIALAQYGINNAVATLGTATSKTHLERLYRGCPEVLFCFDGDEAGRKAAFRALEAALPCMEDGRQARFLFLPQGQDPDDAVRAGGTEAFLRQLDEAVPLESFLFDALAADIDMSSLEGRARLSKLALPHLRQLPEGVYRQLMFQALAERTGLELASLMQLEVPPATPTEEAPPPWASAPPEADIPADDEHEAPQPRRRPALQVAPSGFDNLAQKAIALILHKPDIAQLANNSILQQLAGPDIALLNELLELLKRRPESNTGMIMGHWYGTPAGETINHLAGQERLIQLTGIEQEFVDTLARIEQKYHQHEFSQHVDKLRSANYAELSDLDKQKLRELLQRKKD
jgi:DNA primase